MTKIKNTKKGMAKKTLSISLAVAMLATSNVPVWAAEFTDGTDAAFTSEVEAPVEVVDEAPVVEEVVEAPVAEVAADYKLDTNMELASGTWNDTVKLVKKEGVTDAAKFEISKNGVPVALDQISYEVYYNDDMVTGNGKIDKVSDSMQLMKAAPGLDAYKGGKKVTVKFYVTGEKEAAATFETTLKAVNLTDAVITYNKKWQDYNGKSQRPAAADLSVTLNGANVSSDAYVVKFADDEEAKNYKENGYQFAVEGVEEKGYVGTSKYTGKFVIGRISANKDNLSVVLSGEATYNGKNTKPTVVVTDKLSGATIPSELYEVKLDSHNIGEYTSDKATITMNESANVGSDTELTYNNFKAEDVAKECVTGSFKINALDLSKLGDKYTVEVKAQEIGDVGTLKWDQIILTDKATGKIVKAEAVLPTDELAAVITNNATAGKGRLTIKATDVKNQNVINEYVTDVTVSKNVMTEADVALPKGTKITSLSTPLPKRTALSDSSLKKEIQDALNATVYTGSALEPLKSVFESIVWVNDAPNGEDMKFVLGKDYNLTYTENKDSETVSGKKATVTLKFQGDYVGTVSYDFSIQQAEAFVTGADIAYTPGQNSYDANVKVVTKSGTIETAVPTTEYIVKTTKKARKIGDTAIADVVFTNPNYKINGSTNVNADKCAYVKDIQSKLVGKSLEAESVTAIIEGTYTYTGKEITPTIVVKDGDTTLKLGTDYKIVAKHGTEAGEAYVTIEGIGNYSGKLTLKYTIEKADLATATVLNEAGKENYDVSYDGLAQKPDVAKVKIGDTELEEYNPITKSGDYELTWNLDAVEVGTYEFTITAVASSTKVQGTFKGTYKVIPSELSAHYALKSNPSKEVSSLTAAQTGAYYTGKAYTVNDFKTKVVVYDKDASKVLTEGTDYRLVYENNVDAGKATVKAYGIGNHAYTDKNGKEVAIATLTFEIDAKDTIATNWIRKINDVEYAGGLPVEPEVVVADNDNNRLVQGVDFTVETTVTEIGDYTQTNITIKGKGAYVAKSINNEGVQGTNLSWKVTKKDLKNTTISVDKNDNVIVMNGTVVVPSTEYTVAFNADGSKVTVTAKEDSKHYTGSKEQDVDMAKVGQAMIKEVKVVGNKATVVLSDKVENAEGYDFVIATEADYKNGRVDITKNQLKTSGDFTYVQKGVYYAYCHAWKRDENNQKVFGDWSNLFQFTVSATTPETPVITSVKRSGKNVTVTYKNAKNAEGYDVVLGSKRTKVNGELRPVEYGKLVQKNKTTTTVTFKNVPKGSYYVGMHAYNRSSVDNKKVFSRWANWSSRVTVK